MNLQGSKIKASRTKTAWKSAENSKKTAEKSVNLLANFDKNKKASRIKALRESAMKRLTDFFWEKGWRMEEIGYNENRKRSKYCCWTVPMSDWNESTSSNSASSISSLNRTYEWLKQLTNSSLFERNNSYTVSMIDNLLLLNLLFLHEYFECLSS